MKYNIILYVLLLIGYGFTSCAKEPEKLKIGVMTDPHYLSEQLMDNGSAILKAVDMSGKAITDVPQILDQVLADYLNSDINVLLIPGDMTKDGEKQSHIDFVKKLQPLIDKGVKVFVVPGNHDINVPNSQRYEGDKTYSVDNVSPSDFTQIYADCGYNSAIERDTASLSYVAKLNDKTWLLAIDGCRYKEYTTSTLSGGKIQPATEQWLMQVMNQARQKNIQVVGMMHHGLVEHIMLQATVFKDYVINDWQRLAPQFADAGMKAIFTGHFHANDVTEFRSPQGNKIYDIETASLCAYPFAYRFVELDEQGMRISSRFVTSIPAKPNLWDDNRAIMEQRGRSIAASKLNAVGLKLSNTTTPLLIDMIGKIFVMHLLGDEVVDPELRESMKKLAEDLDVSTPLPINSIELDFYPADNNLKITFGD